MVTITWTRNEITGSYWSEDSRFLIEWDSDRDTGSQNTKVARWILYDYQLREPARRHVGRGKVTDLKRQAEGIQRREQQREDAERGAEEAKYEAGRRQAADSPVARPGE